MVWLMIALLLLGTILVTIEAVVPGFSIPGILGICCLIGGLIVASTIVDGTALLLLIAGVLVMIVPGRPDLSAADAGRPDRQGRGVQQRR